ncbi:GTPase HflX [Thermofilum pendens]|uniref:GTPase HflX n=1 Tax=Thermofilum pendens (strain DSM 2475 / Hrk 5) TaxID=368408 RepID=HFLX_THEPD|nr:GTPase HflX [Thermofilum pendens]A1RY30.1 RecName: Full=GTPase HflX; AltName: Full=GTP-binding protein HflX [Thermofilum pendens Hrk 5]ABL78110.1 small GTP-binding protein [Thermofilum pendens Hrk 5]
MSVDGRQAVIVVARLSGKGDLALLDELRKLVEAAGYAVAGELLQKSRYEDPKYNIGRGKVLELKRLVEEKKPLKVVFLNDLKPNQAYNLSKETGVEVIDRYELILEIFAKRAGSRESKLQIELAKLKRELSFAKEYINLAKRGELHGFLGGGKYAVDAYYAYVSMRISKIEEELRKIRKMKEERIARRVEAGLYTVALTGYTGAGKTTLFNVLTGENGYIDGKPFATLSTLSRRTYFHGFPVLVTDTIGFIDDLPDALVDAFYTTLRETLAADVILLVLDVSDTPAEIRRKLTASMEVLLNLGVPPTRILLVGNKIDKVSSAELEERERLLEDSGLRYTLISAARRIGIHELTQAVVEMLPEKVSATLALTREALAEDLRELLDRCRVREVVQGSDGKLLVVVEGRRDIVARLQARAGMGLVDG